MTTTNPVAYLPFINAQRDKPLSPDSKVECAICPTVFPIKTGKAFMARCNDQMVTALFCTYGCYLTNLPKECCGHA